MSSYDIFGKFYDAVMERSERQNALADTSAMPAQGRKAFWNLAAAQAQF